MTFNIARSSWLLSFTGMALCMGVTLAQSPVSVGRGFVVIPQRRAFPLGGGGQVVLTRVKAGTVIVEQVATTTLDINLSNPGGRRLEAELLVPVPPGAVVRGFTFQGAASEARARVLPLEEARRTYDEIVRRVRDPALLEFAGYNLIRSSVFPVEANGTQKVRLTYENLLPADGGRVDYVLPRSEAIDYRVPWEVSVKIKSRRPISTVYSPSHDIQTIRTSPHEISVRTASRASTQPGAFRLSYLLGGEGVSASLLAYPDPKIGGGYFLLLAGSPERGPGEEGELEREVTLVLDRSGSMNGEKLEQVREAALQIIAGLENGETFNIIAYNEAIDLFSPKPVVKTEESVKKVREFLKGIHARGGTNIHDALVEALRQQPSPDKLPLVLFLTDGLPTIGQTSEVAIRDVAIKGNPHKRRVFTFGVGTDVNTPLLERIASVTRATAAFVLPKESVEVKVAGVFKRLVGPTLASPRLSAVDDAGKLVTGRVHDIMPRQIPDLFEDDQMVLLGTYRGDKPLRFLLSGNYRGKERTFQLTFSLDAATTQNAFVPRLWASRKIAYLEDAIRDLGADSPSGSAILVTAHDPRMKELVDEIVRLSTEFGVLSEYTAFLAHEGTDLSQKDKVLREANGNFARRNSTRSGSAGLNQELNRIAQKGQKTRKYFNGYLDQNLQHCTVASIQQVNDKTFYRRGTRWVDSQLIEVEKQKPNRVISFGSAEFTKLLMRLVGENRQGCVSLKGDILLQVDGESVLIQAGPQTPQE